MHFCNIWQASEGGLWACWDTLFEINRSMQCLFGQHWYLAIWWVEDVACFVSSSHIGIYMTQELISNFEIFTVTSVDGFGAGRLVGKRVKCNRSPRVEFLHRLSRESASIYEPRLTNHHIWWNNSLQERPQRSSCDSHIPKTPCIPTLCSSKLT